MADHNDHVLNCTDKKSSSASSLHTDDVSLSIHPALTQQGEQPSIRTVTYESVHQRQEDRVISSQNGQNRENSPIPFEDHHEHAGTSDKLHAYSGTIPGTNQQGTNRPSASNDSSNERSQKVSSSKQDISSRQQVLREDKDRSTSGVGEQEETEENMDPFQDTLADFSNRVINRKIRDNRHRDTPETIALRELLAIFIKFLLIEVASDLLLVVKSECIRVLGVVWSFMEKGRSTVGSGVDSLPEALDLGLSRVSDFVRNNQYRDNEQTMLFRQALAVIGEVPQLPDSAVTPVIKSECARLLETLWKAVGKSIEKGSKTKEASQKQSPEACPPLPVINTAWRPWSRRTPRIKAQVSRVMHECMTVFQSKPLVWLDKNQKPHPFPWFDFEHEKQLVLMAFEEAAAKTGRWIQVSFESANTFRLSAYLALPQNRILHLSCQGRNEYLTMENEGAMQPLAIHEVEILFKDAKYLKLVFLSACASLAAGEALVKVGVPHVVCHKGDVNDSEAIEFTRTFYLHLACGQSLKQAFNMAKAAVKASPMPVDAERFLLLSKTDANPENEFFFKEQDVNVKSQAQPDMTKDSPRMLLPSFPNNIFGREIEIYNAIEHVMKSRFVQISGVPGIGKSTLAHAMCAYIDDRKDVFSFEDVFWLPSLRQENDGDDVIVSLNRVLQLVSSKDAKIDSERFSTCCDQAIASLRGIRAIIFIEGHKMRSGLAMTKLKYFLELLFLESLTISVVVVNSSGEEIKSEVIPYEAHLALGPLNMRSSAVLFGNRCAFVQQGRRPSIRTPKQFADLVVPPFQAGATRIDASMSKRCIEIFSRIGEGNPRWIGAAAESMTAKEYDELIKIGMRKELNRAEIDTRVKLERKWIEVNAKYEAARKVARKSGNYDQAIEFKAELDELEQLRKSLPTLEELEQTVASLYEQRVEADELEQFDKAKEISVKISRYKKKVQKEKKAADAAEEKDAKMGLRRDQHEKTPISGQATSLSSSGSFVITSKKAGSEDTYSFLLTVTHSSIVDFSFPDGESAIVCATNENCHTSSQCLESAACAIHEAGGKQLHRDVAKLESRKETSSGSIGSRKGEERLMGERSTGPRFGSRNCGALKVDRDVAKSESREETSSDPILCRIGEARIIGPPSETRNYGDLKVPYVIFAVGPTYAKDDGPNALAANDELLLSAYMSSLEQAQKKHLVAIGFSLISAGHRAGGDIERSLRIAIQAIAEFNGYKELREVRLCAYNKTEADLLIRIARELNLKPGGLTM